MFIDMLAFLKVLLIYSVWDVMGIEWLILDVSYQVRRHGQ